MTFLVLHCVGVTARADSKNYNQIWHLYVRKKKNLEIFDLLVVFRPQTGKRFGFQSDVLFMKLLCVV